MSKYIIRNLIRYTPRRLAPNGGKTRKVKSYNYNTHVLYLNAMPRRPLITRYWCGEYNTICMVFVFAEMNQRLATCVRIEFNILAEREQKKKNKNKKFL